MRFNLSVDYNIELPQNKTKTSTAASSKAEASSSFKGFGFFKTLNTTWFNTFVFIQVKETTLGVFTLFLLVSSRYLLIRSTSPENHPSSFLLLSTPLDFILLAEGGQIKKLRKAMHKAVLIDFQKINRLFLRFNQLFLSTVNKNNLEQIYVRSGKEIITQIDLYWFILTPRVTSNPQKPLIIHYAIKTRLQTPHTKVVTLNLSRNTLPLANHTKNVDLEHLKKTQHSLATQIQK